MRDLEHRLRAQPQRNREGGWSTNCNDLLLEAANALASRDQRIKELMPYVQHQSGCPRHPDVADLTLTSEGYLRPASLPSSCTCALAALLVEEEPKGRSAEAEPFIRPEGCICTMFRDTGGFRIADLLCPVHGVDGMVPGDGPWEHRLLVEEKP